MQVYSFEACKNSKETAHNSAFNKKQLLFIQPKLTINQPNDMYEQEADAMADKVMRMSDKNNNFFKPVSNSIQRKCAYCEEKDKNVQMKQEGAVSNEFMAPAAVHDAINSKGKPLDAATKNFMEQRFDHDFSNVQIHNDLLAHQSSKEINALAYTHGKHIVFNSNQYNPNTTEGKKLLAHELTHVIQQGGGGNVIQRQPIKPAVGQSGNNIIISLDDDPETKIQSGIRIKGAKQIRAYSVQDLATKLGKFSGKIDNIIIFSHGSGFGAVKFVDKNKKETWVDIAELTKALTGKISIQVNNIEFEGCSLANADTELKSFGKAVNATGLKAHSCFTFSHILAGIKVNNKLVKKRSDIKKADETLFQKILLEQAQKQLVAANGTSVTDCVEGITQGQALDINELETVFFTNNGVINAEWDSPRFNNDWQLGSICKRDVSPTTSPCKLMEITP